MMAWKWWKMVRRLNHRDVFESAIQDILDYFSNRVSEPSLTYRNELINGADEASVGASEGERVASRLKLLTAAAYTEQWKARTLSQRFIDTVDVSLESVQGHCVDYSQEKSESRTGWCGYM